MRVGVKAGKLPPQGKTKETRINVSMGTIFRGEIFRLEMIEIETFLTSVF